jgi:hypothetical protein
LPGSETRIIRNNFKIRNIKTQNSSPTRICLQHWGFLSFDVVSKFRISCFEFTFFLGAHFDLAEDMLCVFARDIFQFWLRVGRGGPFMPFILDLSGRQTVEEKT